MVRSLLTIGYIVALALIIYGAELTFGHGVGYIIGGLVLCYELYAIPKG